MHALPPAVLSSGFRPFYVVGPLFGLATMALWLCAFAGATQQLPALFSQPLFHGHEMINGFAGAMCGGFLLTAIPTWAETEAVVGARLALLVAAWLAGRIAVVLAGALPPVVVAAADLLFWPLLAAFIAPTAWAARNRLYRLVLPVLGGFAAGNLVFHAGLLAGAADVARVGVRVGFYALMVLYCLFAGLLTPIFSETWLRQSDPAVTIRIRPGLEVLAIAAVLAMAALDLAGAPQRLLAAAALGAAVVLLVRMLPWRSAAIIRSPLLVAMHLGQLAFIAACGLRAVAALSGADDPAGWVHGFTIGAWGLTKFSLITRVSLKHTGRPLTVPATMILAFLCIGLAALARVLAAFGLWWSVLLPASAVLWSLPLALYLMVFLPVLVRPSRPYRARVRGAPNG